VINEGKVKVRTRKGLDWTEKFPAIVDDAAIIPCRNAIIDGEAVVLDDKMPDGHGRIAHLMLANEEDDDLRCVGAVGTGWSEAEGLALKKRLDALSMPQAALEGVKAKGAVWTAPTLRAQIAYRGWTSGGELRQASFKGLREE
jgi:bifunctional non-homologous end joining protein LigD